MDEQILIRNLVIFCRSVLYSNICAIFIQDFGCKILLSSFAVLQEKFDTIQKHVFISVM